MIALPAKWYCYIVKASEDRPGIYQWDIEAVGIYIGSRITRPTKHYGRNVRRLLNNLPYRRGKPDEFRTIHHALERAHKAGTRITLTILENVDDAAARSRRETELIALRGSLNNPPFGRKPLQGTPAR
jgi:hypothetical protein